MLLIVTQAKFDLAYNVVGGIDAYAIEVDPSIGQYWVSWSSLILPGHLSSTNVKNQTHPFLWRSHYLSCWLFQSYLWYRYNRKFTSLCGKTDESAHNFAVHDWLCHINKHLLTYSKFNLSFSSSNTSLYSVPLLASSCIHQLSASHPCWSSKYNVQRAWIETHTDLTLYANRSHQANKLSQLEWVPLMTPQ